MLKKILVGLGVIVIAVVAGVPAYFYTVYPKSRPAPDMKAPTHRRPSRAAGISWKP